MLTPHVADQNPEGFEILNRGGGQRAGVHGWEADQPRGVIQCVQTAPTRHPREIMPSWLFAILTLLAAYLLGAIPFGFLLARWHGVDIFTQGSGNIGTTNVGRVLGRKVGVLVFALDFTKGAGAVALAIWVGAYFDDRLWSAGFVEVALAWRPSSGIAFRST